VSRSRVRTPFALSQALYAALAKGEAETLRLLLAPDFRARLTPGLPWDLGRHRVEGAGAMIHEVWEKVAEELEMTPVPEQTYVVDDVAVVQGTYRGRSRRTGRSLVAWFVHIWLIEGERLVELKQVTDTAAWWAAVDDLRG